MTGTMADHGEDWQLVRVCEISAIFADNLAQTWLRRQYIGKVEMPKENYDIGVQRNGMTDPGWEVWVSTMSGQGFYVVFPNEDGDHDPLKEAKDFIYWATSA